MTDFVHLNQRLGRATFISHPADRTYFEALVNHIRSLAERHKRDVEKYIPDVNGANAWSRAFEIWEAFVELDRKPQDPTVTAPVIAQAAREKLWNDYLNDRTFFLELMRRRDISKLDAEFLGLEEGDLGPPTTQDDPEAVKYNGGKRMDWIDVAWRINQALGKWHSLSKGDKASIPIVMATRRQEAASRELAKRMAALEANQPTTENAA